MSGKLGLHPYIANPDSSIYFHVS